MPAKQFIQCPAGVFMTRASVVELGQWRGQAGGGDKDSVVVFQTPSGHTLIALKSGMSHDRRTSSVVSKFAAHFNYVARKATKSAGKVMPKHAS